MCYNISLQYLYIFNTFDTGGCQKSAFESLFGEKINKPFRLEKASNSTDEFCMTILTKNVTELSCQHCHIKSNTT